MNSKKQVNDLHILHIWTSVLISFAILMIVGTFTNLIPAKAETPIKSTKTIVVVPTTVLFIDTPAESVKKAVRLPHRLIVIGDSSLSLWQDDLALAVSENGSFARFDISEIIPVAQEGKLPCFFNASGIIPGDIVLMELAVSEWHRTENDICNPFNAPDHFYEWLDALTSAIVKQGGFIIPFAAPRNLTDVNFGGKPWYPNLHPYDIANRLSKFSPLIGENCRKTEILRDDKYHVDPSWEVSLAECMVQASELP